MKWFSAQAHVPDRIGLYLCYIDDQYETPYELCNWQDGEWIDVTGEQVTNVSHWAKLPGKPHDVGNWVTR